MPKPGRHAHRRRRRPHRVERKLGPPTAITTRCTSCAAEAAWVEYFGDWVPLGATIVCAHHRDHVRGVRRIVGGAREAQFGSVTATRA